jgi:hypothetical protein
MARIKEFLVRAHPRNSRLPAAEAKLGTEDITTGAGQQFEKVAGFNFVPQPLPATAMPSPHCQGEIAPAFCA